MSAITVLELLILELVVEDAVKMKKATPKRTPMSAKEKIIAKGEKRNAEDYPTMADIVSDWESKDDVDKKNSKSRKVKKGESGSVIFESMIRGGEEIDITMRSEKSKKKLEEHLDRGDNKGKEKLAGGVIERKDNMERQEEKPEEKQGKTGEDALERQINAESDKKRKDREGKCSTDNANVVEIKDNGITESERNVEINSTKKKLNMTDMNKECYASLMKNKSSAHEPQATTEKPDYSKTKLHREAVEKKGEANKNEKDSVYMETDACFQRSTSDP
uniref:Uncharacterized protein n=1 Tax=Angiostrongylus cantonensis TaxID=6313 RepID=A0A0K0DQP8_ANGCA